MSTELATRPEQSLAVSQELTVEELALKVKKIHEVMAKVMKPDVHYGIIPGTRKPTLYKPGAELLNMLFRFDPQPTIEETREGDHYAVRATITLWHTPSGLRMGSGMGSCSTREAKYAYRKSWRKCPTCSKDDTIIKGKAQYGGGWLCFRKKGGCGAQFKDGDQDIEGQQTEERIANPDLPDSYNTVLKMAMKRALVAAVLNVTAASDIFTQDVAQDDEDEDLDGEGAPRREGPGDARSQEQSPDGPISEAQGKRLWAIAREHVWDQEQVKDLLTSFKVNSTKEIPRSVYDRVIDQLKARAKSAS